MVVCCFVCLALTTCSKKTTEGAAESLKIAHEDEKKPKGKVAAGKPTDKKKSAPDSAALEEEAETRMPKPRPEVRETNVAADKKEQPGNAGEPAAADVKQPIGQAKSVEEANPEQPPKAEPVHVPVYLVETACSSSDQPVDTGNGGSVTYVAWAVSDGTGFTAWAEGAEGDGIGEWVELTLPQEFPVHSLTVFNGYQKNKGDQLGDRYPINQRVKGLEISCGPGQKKTVELKDEREPQTILLDGVKADKIKLTIRSVYSAKYKDTCLSEVHVSVLAKPEDVIGAIPGTLPEARAAMAVAGLISSFAPDRLAQHLDLQNHPLVWEDCNLDGISDSDRYWKRPKGVKTVLRTKDDVQRYFDRLDNRELYSIAYGGVRKCKKGVCHFDEYYDYGKSLARVRSIGLKKAGGRWIATSAQLMAYR